MTKQGAWLASTAFGLATLLPTLPLWSFVLLSFTPFAAMLCDGATTTRSCFYSLSLVWAGPLLAGSSFVICCLLLASGKLQASVAVAACLCAACWVYTAPLWMSLL